MRELWPSDSTFDAMCSGYESGSPSNVMWCATTTAGSGQLSSSRTRRSFVCGGSFGMSRGTGRSDFGTRPRYLRDELLRFLRVEVADEHERRVVRHVVGAEEVADVVDRRGLEILHAADRRVLVGMDGERLVVDELVQPAVRLVVDAHPPLFLHDLALGLEDVLVDPQRREPIGFEPEHERQVLRRHRLPEHRRVFGRVRVALPADARDPRRMPFGLDVLRALEHHVLEQVREAGPAGPLVLRPDVIPDLRVDDRRRVILEEDDLHARSAAWSSCSRAGSAASRRAAAGSKTSRAASASSSAAGIRAVAMYHEVQEIPECPLIMARAGFPPPVAVVYCRP